MVLRIRRLWGITQAVIRQRIPKTLSPEIRIERVCNGNTHLETHTDSKGRFYFQIGQEAALDTDASDSSNGRFLGSSTTTSPMNGPRSNGTGGYNSLWGCDLRAAYPGYRSDSVSLATRQSMDEPEIGTLVLHRLANVKGSTLSVTTALAPKKAQKDYEKGLQLLQKGKIDEAEKYLSQATDTYPKYAIAWVALGQAELQQKKTAEARKAFQTAIAADSKLVSPYDQLALLSAQEGKWQDAADFSKQALELNPVEFPSSYWYNALASYNLKRNADTEKDLAELIKLGGTRRLPQAETLMAQVLAEKGDLTGAATHLKTYLAIAPNASNADLVKQELVKIEGATASAKK